MSLLKRIGLIVGLLAISGLVAYGLYFMFVGTTKIGQPQPPTGTTLPRANYPSPACADHHYRCHAVPGYELLPIGIIQSTTLILQNHAVNQIVSKPPLILP